MLGQVRLRATETFKGVFKKIDRASGGRLSVLQNAFQSYIDNRAGEGAASIAYYTLFSLFPLLLLMLAGLTIIVERESARRQLLAYIDIILPVSQTVITTYLDKVLQNAPTFGLVALVGLLWSSTGAFTSLAVNINRAWSEAHVRNFLEARLVGVGMLGVLAGLLFLSLLVTTGLDLLAHFRLPIRNSLLIYESLLFIILADLLPFLARLLMFFGIYLWVPKTPVPWRAAFWGALVVTLLWELITRLFTLYLSSPYARFETVYGSLGTLVVLMLWIYMASSIVLFGAHLTACITKTKNITV